MEVANFYRPNITVGSGNDTYVIKSPVTDPRRLGNGA